MSWQKEETMNVGMFETELKNLEKAEVAQQSEPQPQGDMSKIARALGISPDAPFDVVLGEVEFLVKFRDTEYAETHKQHSFTERQCEAERIRANQLADTCGNLRVHLEDMAHAANRWELRARQAEEKLRKVDKG